MYIGIQHYPTPNSLQLKKSAQIETISEKLPKN